MRKKANNLKHRYFVYRQSWKNAKNKTPKIPLNIDLELSATCNLACPFCFRFNKNYKSPKEKHMPIELAQKIIDEAAEIGVPALKFNWRGEPTRHPHFSMILYYARQKKFLDLIVNTNGNYDEDAYDGLMAATKVIFSVDTFDFKIYEKMRPGGDLYKVILNIERLALSNHHGIVVSRVLTKDNEKERCFQYNAHKICGKIVKVRTHAEFERKGKSKMNLERIYCEYPSQRLVINTEGDVFPCCIDYFETMPMGNIKKQSLLEIWKSEKMEKLRAELKQNILTSAMCKNCTSWAAYKHENRELLKK